MNNDDKKHTIYDLGYDRLLNRTDVVEENERQFQQRIKEERDEQERRERLRIQRIASSGKSPLLYTLDVIIDKCTIDEMSDRVEINFYALGFPDSIQEVMGVFRFFNKLKDIGCFQTVERSANIYFIVTKPNLEKLMEQKLKLERKLGLHAQLPNSVLNFNGSQVHFGGGDNVRRDKIVENKPEAKKPWWKRPEPLSIVTILVAIISIPWWPSLLSTFYNPKSETPAIPWLSSAPSSTSTPTTPAFPTPTIYSP